MNITDLAGNFLIAVPQLDDPNFKRAVIVLCEHTKEGAFGLIINKILMNSFKPLLSAFDIEKSSVDIPIYYGGPVRPEQGYVIYSPFDRKYGTIRITESIAITDSKDILHDISKGKGPAQYLFALGFSGWAPDQLEEELMADSWLLAPLNHDVVFATAPEDRWKEAAALIGVDFERFFSSSGSA